ncbi:germin-like protein subfamily 1 member 20 [Mercurialis annua]|uniref:germin-like protein subfamily 1 member 20 n=1 Tax=Mercurialis annua TaxID=3986 RepID=UPI00215F5F84|nr:germin-like protein subfamily 1 member 20 [Mercurialis annua]
MRPVDIFQAIFAFLALVIPISSAQPLNDFCVAPTDTKSGVFENGEFCKDPKRVTPSDFFYSGLNIPGNTSNQFGVNVTAVTVEQLKGLNNNGLALTRIDFAPNGVNPIHHNPRGTEVMVVLKGILYVGFITSNPDHRLVAKILRPGDVYVFPLGLIHFQKNIGKTHAVTISAYSSESPGQITTANTIFGSVPPIQSDVLTKSFQIDEKLVAYLQTRDWTRP